MFHRKSKAFSVQRERLRAINCPCEWSFSTCISDEPSFISYPDIMESGWGGRKDHSQTLYLSLSLIGREGTVKCCGGRQSRSGIPIIIWGEGGYCRFPFAVSAVCGKLRSSFGLCILPLAAHAGRLCAPRASKRKKKSTSNIVIIAFFDWLPTDFFFSSAPIEP